MGTVLLVEKTARALDEVGRTAFNEVDIQKYIRRNLKKDIPIDTINEAVETLLVSSKKESPTKKCLYREKNGGYPYLHTCSFGVN